MRGALVLVLGVLISGSALSEEPSIEACRSALASEQPAEAQMALAHAAASPVKQVLTARIELALGRPTGALRALGVASADALPVSMSTWDPGSRGEAMQTSAEVAIASGEPELALALLDRAVTDAGNGVEPDRCLALAMDTDLRLNDQAAATRVAQRLWQGWPRSRYRSRGGLLLAQQASADHPTLAREILAAIRLDRAATALVHRTAVELLCRLLLPIHPGQCVVVAEQEIGHVGESSGHLPLYRALALCRLDPGAGAQALRELPAALSADPAVAPALDEAERVHRVSIEMRIEGAQAVAALGHPEQALATLEPLAASEPLALAAVLSLSGSDPSRYLQAPSASDPVGAGALAGALVLRQRPAEAWTVLQPLMPSAEQHPAEPGMAAVLFWSSQAAPTVAERRRLRGLCLASAPPSGIDSGLTWCAEAEDREHEGGDATAAWVAAAHALPSDHPYLPEAAWRAARGLAVTGDPRQARLLVTGAASWEGDSAPYCRCRFLLAQLCLQAGDRAEAWHALKSLQGLGTAEQQQRLESLIKQFVALAP